MGWEFRVRHPQAPRICPAPTALPTLDTHSSSMPSASAAGARIASSLALFAEQQVEEWGLLPATLLLSHLLPLPPG